MSDLKELTFVDDYSPSIKALLYSQFQGDRSPNIQKVIDAFSKPLNEVEQVAKDIYTQLNLDDAVGEQLDGLGQIIGLSRDGRDDEEYRAALRFKIQLNKSFGQPELLISALRFFTDSTIVQLFEAYPAALFAYINGLQGLSDLTEKMNRLSLGGVNFMYIAQVEDIPFAFDATPEDDFGLGFAWDTGSGINTEDAGAYAWALPT